MTEQDKVMINDLNKLCVTSKLTFQEHQYFSNALAYIQNCLIELAGLREKQAKADIEALEKDKETKDVKCVESESLPV